MITLIHYGELALKGNNRGYFERKLIENIRNACSGRAKRLRGRIVLENGDAKALKNIFGITWFANAFRVEKDLGSLKEQVISSISDISEEFETFGVFVKRADKNFPYTSVETAKIVGREIVENFNLRVNLKNPELRVYIEIAEQAFVFFEKVQGLGGLPVGISGKVLCLLSGGIDSPVAAYLMMKRGCEVKYIHFHTLKNNREVLETKIKDLLENLGKYQFNTQLILVPYQPFHLALLGKGFNGSYELVLFRRFMARLSERIALLDGCQALVTGDSLGQVASQTLENLNGMNKSVSMPIFQPLISFDKQEIIDLARKMESYDISIKPYKDCCSIMATRPRTRMKLNKIEMLEKTIGLKGVMEETLKLKEVYNL